MSPAVIADRLDARALAHAHRPRDTGRRGQCPTLAEVRRACRMARRARLIAARPTNHHSTTEVPA